MTQRGFEQGYDSRRVGSGTGQASELERFQDERSITMTGMGVAPDFRDESPQDYYTDRLNQFEYEDVMSEDLSIVSMSHTMTGAFEASGDCHFEAYYYSSEENEADAGRLAQAQAAVAQRPAAAQLFPLTISAHRSEPFAGMPVALTPTPPPPLLMPPLSDTTGFRPIVGDRAIAPTSVGGDTAIPEESDLMFAFARFEGSGAPKRRITPIAVDAPTDAILDVMLTPTPPPPGVISPNDLISEAVAAKMMGVPPPDFGSTELGAGSSSASDEDERGMLPLGFPADSVVSPLVRTCRPLAAEASAQAFFPPKAAETAAARQRAVAAMQLAHRRQAQEQTAKAAAAAAAHGIYYPQTKSHSRDGLMGFGAGVSGGMKVGDFFANEFAPNAKVRLFMPLPKQRFSLIEHGEIERVLRTQLHHIMSDDPLNDDFYSQVFNARIGREFLGFGVPGTGNVYLDNAYSKLTHSDGSSVLPPGTLGRTTFATVHAPPAQLLLDSQAITAKQLPAIVDAPVADDNASKQVPFMPTIGDALASDVAISASLTQDESSRQYSALKQQRYIRQRDKERGKASAALGTESGDKKKKLQLAHHKSAETQSTEEETVGGFTEESLRKAITEDSYALTLAIEKGFNLVIALESANSALFYTHQTSVSATRAFENHMQRLSAGAGVIGSQFASQIPERTKQHSENDRKHKRLFAHCVERRQLAYDILAQYIGVFSVSAAMQRLTKMRRRKARFQKKFDTTIAAAVANEEENEAVSNATATGGKQHKGGVAVDAVDSKRRRKDERTRQKEELRSIEAQLKRRIALGRVRFEILLQRPKGRKLIYRVFRNLEPNSRECVNLLSLMIANLEWFAGGLAVGRLTLDDVQFSQDLRLVLLNRIDPRWGWAQELYERLSTDPPLDGDCHADSDSSSSSPKAKAKKRRLHPLQQLWRDDIKSKRISSDNMLFLLNLLGEQLKRIHRRAACGGGSDGRSAAKKKVGHLVRSKFVATLLIIALTKGGLGGALAIIQRDTRRSAKPAMDEKTTADESVLITHPRMHHGWRDALNKIFALVDNDLSLFVPCLLADDPRRKGAAAIEKRSEEGKCQSEKVFSSAALLPKAASSSSAVAKQSTDKYLNEDCPLEASINLEWELCADLFAILTPSARQKFVVDKVLASDASSAGFWLRVRAAMFDFMNARYIAYFHKHLWQELNRFTRRQGREEEKRRAKYELEMRQKYESWLKRTQPKQLERFKAVERQRRLKIAAEQRKTQELKLVSMMRTPLPTPQTRKRKALMSSTTSSTDTVQREGRAAVESSKSAKRALPSASKRSRKRKSRSLSPPRIARPKRKRKTPSPMAEKWKRGSEKYFARRKLRAGECTPPSVYSTQPNPPSFWIDFEMDRRRSEIALVDEIEMRRKKLQTEREEERKRIRENMIQKLKDCKLQMDRKERAEKEAKAKAMGKTLQQMERDEAAAKAQAHSGDLTDDSSDELVHVRAVDADNDCDETDTVTHISFTKRRVTKAKAPPESEAMRTEAHSGAAERRPSVGGPIVVPPTPPTEKTQPATVHMNDLSLISGQTEELPRTPPLAPEPLATEKTEAAAPAIIMDPAVGGVMTGGPSAVEIRLAMQRQRRRDEQIKQRTQQRSLGLGAAATGGGGVDAAVTGRPPLRLRPEHCSSTRAPPLRETGPVLHPRGVGIRRQHSADSGHTIRRHRSEDSSAIASYPPPRSRMYPDDAEFRRVRSSGSYEGPWHPFPSAAPSVSTRFDAQSLAETTASLRQMRLDSSGMDVSRLREHLLADASPRDGGGVQLSLPFSGGPSKPLRGSSGPLGFADDAVVVASAPTPSAAAGGGRRDEYSERSVGRSRGRQSRSGGSAVRRDLPPRRMYARRHDSAVDRVLRERGSAKETGFGMEKKPAAEKSRDGKRSPASPPPFNSLAAHRSYEKPPRLRERHGYGGPRFGPVFSHKAKAKSELAQLPFKSPYAEVSEKRRQQRGGRGDGARGRVRGGHSQRGTGFKKQRGRGSAKKKKQKPKGKSRDEQTEKRMRIKKRDSDS